MDLDSLPEERLVPTKAATKASEGRKKRDVLPAEVVDEGLESGQLEQRDTELHKLIPSPATTPTTLPAVPSLPAVPGEQQDLRQEEIVPGEEQEQPDELHEELDDADHGLTRHNERRVELSLSEDPHQQPCCRKSLRFWCLLTVGLSTVVAIVLVIAMTGNYSHSTKSFHFISGSSLPVPSVSALLWMLSILHDKMSSDLTVLYNLA